MTRPFRIDVFSQFLDLNLKVRTRQRSKTETADLFLLILQVSIPNLHRHCLRRRVERWIYFIELGRIL